jgi:hypothetical protein
VAVRLSGRESSARGKRQAGAPRGLSVALASDLGLSLRTYPTCLQYTKAVTIITQRLHSPGPKVKGIWHVP